jgi:DNA-binding NtrC family response regulator
MTVEDRATFRSVILPSENATAAHTAGQLLNEYGHQVVPAQSPRHALELLGEEHTDLLIVDLSDSARNGDFLARLAELPITARPDQLAIFTDGGDENFGSLRSQIKPSKLQVFLKPLHMHGLLGILRRMEAMKQPARAFPA